MCFAECVCAAQLDMDRQRERRQEGGERADPGTVGAGSEPHAGELGVKDLMQGIGKGKAMEWRSRTHSLILSLAKQTSRPPTK